MYRDHLMAPDSLQLEEIASPGSKESERSGEETATKSSDPHAKFSQTAHGGDRSRGNGDKHTPKAHFTSQILQNVYLML